MVPEKKKNMQTSKENTSSFFSSICVDRCKGICCDPWWGIISYTVVKPNGLSNLEKFRGDLAAGIRTRAKRIIENYITKEAPPRPLFSSPEKYNVRIRNIKVDGSAVTLEVMAMFAFRCLFMSEDKTCSIHPAIGGTEIRPPHCGYMGSLNVRPDEKGYCRIIHAAESGGEEEVRRAIGIERSASETHYSTGVRTPEEAADGLISNLKDYLSANAPGLMEERGESPGRNDPCYCGSGVKFKKCHGR